MRSRRSDLPGFVISSSVFCSRCLTTSSACCVSEGFLADDFIRTTAPSRCVTCVEIASIVPSGKVMWSNCSSGFARGVKSPFKGHVSCARRLADASRRRHRDMRIHGQDFVITKIGAIGWPSTLVH